MPNNVYDFKPMKNDHKLDRLKVTGIVRCIFDQMRYAMDGHNLVHMNGKLKREFVSKTSSKSAEPMRVFKDSIRLLKQKGVIQIHSASCYMIDPTYGYRFGGNYKPIQAQWWKLIAKNGSATDYQNTEGSLTDHH